MRRSPAEASASRSASSDASSRFPPPCPAKASCFAWNPPFTVVFPLPPGTAAPSAITRSAWKRPPRRPTLGGRKGASGPSSIGSTLRVRCSGVGTSVGGSGAALRCSSRFCLEASTAARTTTSSGSPARRSRTSTSRSSTKSSFAPGVARSTKAMRAFSTAARSIRTAERSAGFSPAGLSAGASLAVRSASFFESRSMLVVPSRSRITFTRAPSTTTSRTTTSFPREPRARRRSTSTSARGSSSSGTILSLRGADPDAGDTEPEATEELGLHALDRDGASEVARERVGLLADLGEEDRDRARRTPATRRTTSARTRAPTIFGQRRAGCRSWSEAMPPPARCQHGWQHGPCGSQAIGRTRSAGGSAVPSPGWSGASDSAFRRAPGNSLPERPWTRAPPRPEVHRSTAHRRPPVYKGGSAWRLSP